MIRLIICLMLVLGGVGPLHAESPTKQPNIVLIVTDDLGYGDLGCYGGTAIPTPNIDRMAAEGNRLTRCYAPAATCTPTRYAIMTGEYAWRQKERKTTILDGDAPLAIEPGRSTLPEVLRRAGYKTSLIGKWHLGIGDGINPVDFNAYVGPGPLEVGFDEAFYIPATVDRVPCVFINDHAVDKLDPTDPLQISYQKSVGNDPTGKTHPDLLKYPADPQHSGTIVKGISRIGSMSGGKSARWSDETITDVLAEKCQEFLARPHDQPFFLMLGTHDPHVPRAPHSRFVGKSQAGLRGDAIVQCDWLVGQVLDSIKQAGLDGNTLVILTSDNGPTVFDGYFDGSTEAAGEHKPAGNLRGGKYLVYEGGCRVPCVVRWPKTIPAGESNALFSLIDLLPSLAKLAGVSELPADVATDGIMLADVLTNPKAVSVRHELVLEGTGKARALIQEDWKFIPKNVSQSDAGAGRGANARDKRFAGAQIEEDLLFNLADDPQEEHNLAKEFPDKLNKLRQELESRVNP